MVVWDDLGESLDCNDKLTLKSLKLLNLSRVGLGLPPIQPVKINCLKCSRLFVSRDRKSNRICCHCKYLIKKFLENGVVYNE